MQVPSSYILVLAIFTAITAVAVLLQAIAMLGMMIAVRKSIAEFREKALPAIISTRNLVEEISPKLKIATSNLADVSHTLRQQTNHINETVDAMLTKTDLQVRRVDEMVTATFDAVGHATRAFETVISNPVRRVTGVINGVRAGVETFVGAKKSVGTNEAQVTEFPDEKRSAGPAEPKKTDGFPEQKQA